MKKILALIITFSIFLGFAFAQETQETKTTESENNGKYLGFIKDMRAGAFFNFEPAVGDLSEFAFSTIGGGAVFEAGIPLPMAGKNKVVHAILDNFGVNLRMTFDGGLMKDTKVDSLLSMRCMAGVHTKIPLPGNMFSIVPEIGYGAVLNFPKVSGESANYVKKVYVDQILQVGAGVRFSHPAMLKGNLEFDFTPTYSFSPESGSSVHYLGFRFGVLYKFADKSKHVLPAESTASLDSMDISEIESVETEAAESESLEIEEIVAPEYIQLTVEQVQRKDALTERAEMLKVDFENLVEDAEENNLEQLAQKYKEYVKQAEEILKELISVDSEESLDAVEEKLKQLESKIADLEKIEEEFELELDIAVTEMAAKTGHAALIHHPDGSYTIAIPPLTFNANSTGLTISDENKKSLDTLIEVLTTDDRVSNMTVSVYGYINPDSRSEVWTKEEKILAKGRAETIKKYLSENGCTQNLDSYAGEGYTPNAIFNRRVEFLVHN